MNTRQETGLFTAAVIAALVAGLSACGSGSGSGGAPAASAGGSGAGGGGTPVPGTGSATLSWQAPATNTDGSALTDLAGYHIYYGTTSTNLDQIIKVATVGITTYVIDNLAAGTYYFAISAYTTTGIEGAMSATVSKTI